MPRDALNELGTGFQGTSIGIQWFERVWETVGALYTPMRINQPGASWDGLNLCERNTGWDDSADIEPEAMAGDWFGFKNRQRQAVREESQMRAQHSQLVYSADKVLSAMATLLEAAHEGHCLLVQAVQQLHSSGLLSDQQLTKDTESFKRVQVIMDEYRPYLTALPPLTEEDLLAEELAAQCSMFELVFLIT